jgi:adenylate cyclase
VPAGERIDVRIGLNLGDVMIQGDDRHGDSVNIAARLQQLAEPGGIAVSRTIVDHVKSKLALRFESLGEQRVKNISQPIEVFRWAADGAINAQRSRRWLARTAKRRTGAAALATVILIFIAGGGAIYWKLHSPTQQVPAHRLSLVVLPFNNLPVLPSRSTLPRPSPMI